MVSFDIGFRICSSLQSGLINIFIFGVHFSEVNGFGGVGGIGDVGPRGVSPGRPLLTAAEEAALVPPPAPLVRATKATPMHIRFKFGQLGSGKGQFNSPHGFCLGNDEDIIVADTNNHRITVNL